MEDEELICELCGGHVDEDTGEENLDGWICEDCAARLSPWCGEIDTLETEELEEQLQLREENLDALENFHPTRSFYLPGMTEKVFLDDESRTFLVTEGFQIREENPDIISLDEVMDATVEVEDNREKIDSNLYCYSYDLSVNISLDHPYIDSISFALHPESLQFESEEKSFLGFGGFDPEEEPSYKYLASFGQDLCDALLDLEEEINHKYDVRPGEFRLGEPLDEEEEEPDSEENSDAGDVAVCPWCGCRTHVGENFRCEHCGGNL